MSENPPNPLAADLAQARLDEALRQDRARRWRAENAGAVADYNAEVERLGAPLARYQKF